MRAKGALLDVNDPRHEGHAVEDGTAELVGQARGDAVLLSLVHDVGDAVLVALLVPSLP